MARIRTFIAVGLDPAVAGRLVRLQEDLARTETPVNWTERDNLHVTLLFLGEVVDREIHEVCRAVARGCADHSRFTLGVGGVGAFPNMRRPRILWVGLKEGRENLIALHASLEPVLIEQGHYRREDRPYAPHVTLGRLKTDPRDELLAEMMARHANWDGGEFQVNEVLVMSSELTSRGPVYSPLSRAKLQAD